METSRDKDGLDADEEALCRRYAARIRAYGLRHLRDRDAADDLVQHVLLAVLQARREGRIEHADKLASYVMGTCRNAARDLGRQALRQRRLQDRAASEMLESVVPSLVRLDTHRLEHCLLGLEPRARAVVLATFIEERPAQEIATAMEMTAGNVRVVRHRALASLLACMEGGAA